MQTFACSYIGTHKLEITHIIIDSRKNKNSHRQYKLAYIYTYNTKYTKHAAQRTIFTRIIIHTYRMHAHTHTDVTVFVLALQILMNNIFPNTGHW